MIDGGEDDMINEDTDCASDNSSNSSNRTIICALVTALIMNCV